MRVVKWLIDFEGSRKPSTLSPVVGLILAPARQQSPCLSGHLTTRPREHRTTDSPNLDRSPRPRQAKYLQHYQSRCLPSAELAIYPFAFRLSNMEGGCVDSGLTIRSSLGFATKDAVARAAGNKLFKVSVNVRQRKKISGNSVTSISVAHDVGTQVTSSRSVATKLMRRP